MTWWFRIGALGGLALLAFVAHRVRVAALERRHQELQTLTRRLEAAKEDERQRIARELHDDMGQVLSTIKINLQLVPQLERDEDRTRRIEDSVALVDKMIEQVRAISLDLRPPFLEELGLVLALRGYLEAVARRSGLDIEIVSDPGVEGLDAETELHVFRIVQESITNVIRHAEATRAVVRLTRDPEGLEILVRDDGRGFDVDRTLRHASTDRHIGLLGMRERVSSIDGDFRIRSAEGRGTEIRVRVPLGH